MADTKIKNIATVDVLEDSTNKENILVESQGGLKRLPISKIKGSGGGGAGFDLMGKTESSAVVIGGGELIEWEDTEISDPNTELNFEGVFGSASSFTQGNVYLTNCTVGTYGSFLVYGYYDSSESAWIIAAPDAGMTPESFEGIVTIQNFVNLVSNSTFADLKEICEVRPISALVSTLHQAVPSFLYSTADYSASASEFQPFLPPEAQDKELIILIMVCPFNDAYSEKVLVLFEAGTEQEPVLGTVFLDLEDVTG